jgi:hypothetical protein
MRHKVEARIIDLGLIVQQLPEAPAHGRKAHRSGSLRFLVGLSSKITAGHRVNQGLVHGRGGTLVTRPDGDVGRKVCASVITSNSDAARISGEFTRLRN